MQELVIKIPEWLRDDILNSPIDKYSPEIFWAVFNSKPFSEEQKSCDDTINKQTVLDIIHKTIYQFFDVCEEGEEIPLTDKDKLLLSVNKAICNNIKVLEPKTGHWIEIVVNRQHKIKCDKCGYIESKYLTHIRNFCPNCGVRMESEDVDD